ncbi:MAG: hypothetical protein NVSMB4_01020 [Acidimicrobiales bacterium]
MHQIPLLACREDGEPESQRLIGARPVKIIDTFDYEHFDAVINLRSAISHLGEATLPAPGCDAVWPRLIVVDLRGSETEERARLAHGEVPAYGSDPEPVGFAGEDRDRIADDRDRRADDQDRASDARDERANARDERADARNRGHVRSDPQAEEDRAEAKMDRRWAADDRNHARCQRKAASIDRDCVARERATSAASRRSGR